MRRPRTLSIFALMTTCSGMATIVVACTDDESNSAPPGTSTAVDGSTDASAAAEATLPDSTAAVVVDSGSPSDATPDAVTGDAQTNVDAGPPGTVTVLVEDRFQTIAPKPGVHVVFYDTVAGGAITRAITGADGRASAIVHEGATITLVRKYDDEYTSIETIVDVGLGETIEITSEPLGYAVEAQFHFEAAAPPGIADGVQFRFFTGQGGSGGHFVPNTYTTETDYPLVDGTGFRFMGFAPATYPPSNTLIPTKYAVGIAPKNSDGGTTYGTVAVSDWGDVVAGPLSLLGTAPANAIRWTWNLGQAHNLGLYPMFYVDGPAANAALPASYARVPVTAAADVFMDGVLRFDPNGKSQSVHIHREPNTGTIVEDLGSYLPAIATMIASGPVTSPTLTITTASALPATSMIGAHYLSAERPMPDGGVGETDWSILHRAAGGGSSIAVTVPSLPADLQVGIMPTAAAWTARSTSLYYSPQFDYATARRSRAKHQKRLGGALSAYPLAPFDAHYVRRYD